MSSRLDTFDHTRHVPAASKPSMPLRLNERETCSDGEVQIRVSHAIMWRAPLQSSTSLGEEVFFCRASLQAIFLY